MTIIEEQLFAPPIQRIQRNKIFKFWYVSCSLPIFTIYLTEQNHFLFCGLFVSRMKNWQIILIDFWNSNVPHPHHHSGMTSYMKWYYSMIRCNTCNAFFNFTLKWRVTVLGRFEPYSAPVRFNSYIAPVWTLRTRNSPSNSHPCASRRHLQSCQECSSSCPYPFWRPKPCRQSTDDMRNTSTTNTSNSATNCTSEHFLYQIVKALNYSYLWIFILNQIVKALAGSTVSPRKPHECGIK